MSPTDPGRFTNPAVTRHPAELMIPLHPGEERLWVLDDDPSKGPPNYKPTTIPTGQLSSSAPQTELSPPSIRRPLQLPRLSGAGHLAACPGTVRVRAGRPWQAPQAD